MSKIYRTQEITFELHEGMISIIAMTTLAESIIYGEDTFKAGYFIIDVLEQAEIPVNEDKDGNYITVNEDDRGYSYVTLWDSWGKVELVD